MTRLPDVSGDWPAAQWRDQIVERRTPDGGRICDGAVASDYGLVRVIASGDQTSLSFVWRGRLYYAAWHAGAEYTSLLHLAQAWAASIAEGEPHAVGE